MSRYGDKYVLEELLRDKGKRAFWGPKIIRLVNWIYDIDVSGIENVDAVRAQDCPFVVAPNHSGFCDGFIIASILPDLDFAVAKEECWLNWKYRYFVSDLGGIPAVRKDRLDVLRKRYSSCVFDRYINPEGRFRFDRYIPSQYAAAIIEDISNLVRKVSEPKTGEVRPIKDISCIDTVVLAQYVLLRGHNLLIFPQGTRRKDSESGDIRFGTYNILHDLAIFHDRPIPLIPAAIVYDRGIFYSSKVRVFFGAPRTILPYLCMNASDRHERFMSDLMKEIHGLVNQ